MIRVGCRSAAADRMLAQHRVREAALISAYNPFSRKMPAGWNHRMQSRLADTLRHKSKLPATGQWKHWSEAHFLVFCDRRVAVKLAHLFRQNAIVIVRVRQPAYLLITS